MLRILITLSSALLLHSCSLFRPVNSRNVEAMSNQAVLEFLKATRKLTGTNPAIGLGISRRQDYTLPDHGIR